MRRNIFQVLTLYLCNYFPLSLKIIELGPLFPKILRGHPNDFGPPQWSPFKNPLQKVVRIIHFKFCFQDKRWHWWCEQKMYIKYVKKNCLLISCEQKIRIEGPGIVRHFFFTYLIYIFWSHRQRHLLSWKHNLQNVLEFSWKFSHYILGSAKTCAKGPSNRWRLLSLFTLDGWPFDTFCSRTRFTFFVHKKLIDKFFSRTRGNFSHNQKLPPW